MAYRALDELFFMLCLPDSDGAGSRPGVVSAELAHILRKDAVTLGSIVDPLERVKAVGDFYAQLDFELEQFAEVRLEAIKELRAQGWSYDRLAEATGLSKARVGQLAKATQSAGRRARRKKTS